jgi:hypothetical protein
MAAKPEPSRSTEPGSGVASVNEKLEIVCVEVPPPVPPEKPMKAVLPPTIAGRSTPMYEVEKVLLFAGSVKVSNSVEPSYESATCMGSMLLRRTGEVEIRGIPELCAVAFS